MAGSVALCGLVRDGKQVRAIDAMPESRVSIKTAVQPHQLAATNQGRPSCSDYRAGWYILRCGAGSEFRAHDALAKSGFLAFLPVERKERPALFRLKRAITEYPRFPRYLFAHIEPPAWPVLAEWPLSSFACRLVCMDGRAVPLARGEYERLRAEDGRPVPHVSSVPLHRAFQAGDQVRVKAGAWRDWNVRIDALDEHGAHISVPLFGRFNEAVVPLSYLEAA